ncbi:MAG: glycosyltransferase [Myxococcota bacterium]
MPENSIDAVLEKVLAREAAALSFEDRAQTAELFDQLAAAAPLHIPTLLNRNRYRLENPDCVSPNRPRVLIGGMNDGLFPNFHSIPLLRIADVVSLTTGPDEGRTDRVSYDIWSERFSDILDRLPEGFEPDFFFDNQIVGAHMVPAGLEEAPFPTVGSLCHLFRSASNLDIAENFDVLLPLSKTFVEPLRKATGKTVLDLPFGLNWGSFHEITRPAPVKDIDVSCTIGSKLVLTGHSPMRHQLHVLMKDLERRYGDRFNFVTSDGLPREEYFDVLQRSKISINLDNFHGPYNYRNCEIMNSGALCIHVHEPDQFSVKTEIADYFRDGEEIVVSSLEDFEAKLLHALENPEETAAIAAAGQNRLETDYSYEQLYRRLFDEMSRVEIDPEKRVSTARGYYTLGANYFNYEDPNHRPLALLAIPGAHEQEDGPRLNNLLVLGERLSEPLGRTQVLPLLGASPEIARAFSYGIEHAIKTIPALQPENAVLRWTATLLGIEHGITNRDEVLETLALLESSDVQFNPRDYLFIKPELDYLGQPEAGQIHSGLFQHRVVAAYGDEAQTLEIHLEMMRWQCLRWLYENETAADLEAAGQSTADAPDRLAQLLEIWPDNSTLLIRKAERLRAIDPEAAREAFEKALELDPVSEAAMQGLAEKSGDAPSVSRSAEDAPLYGRNGTGAFPTA